MHEEVSCLDLLTGHFLLVHFPTAGTHVGQAVDRSELESG